MVVGIERRVTMLALLFIALISVPSVSSTVMGQPTHPIMAFEPSLNSTIPSPAMPLPNPTPGYTAHPAPISGVIRVLLIAAAFSDIPNQTSISTLKQRFFGTLSAYYHEVSLGTVTIQGDAYGWYKLPYPEQHYGMDCQGIDDADCSGADASWQIANDAALLADKQGVNFLNYDYYVFIHSGYGEESSGVKNDVWSVTYLGGVWVRLSSRTLSRFNIDPELEAAGAVPNGVWCHEFGHNLGLPDLYNTSNGRTILGPWELMDKGLWNGDPAGSSPAHMSAWPKLQLGFISGAQLAFANAGVTSTYTIDPTEVSSGNVHAVEIPLTTTSNPAQYYLVEVRQAIGFDAALPATGVLITYVDNTATIGRIHIMDGHPSVAALADAVWDVGQTFTDSHNNIAVTVAAKVGSAYQIIVNRGGSQPPPPPNNQNATSIDLGISGINSQPQVITSPNTTVTVTVQITNYGSQAANNVPVAVDLDGELYSTTTVSVAAGSVTQTSFTWVSVLGSHVFQITIDPGYTVNDTNRANNVVSITLNVGPVLTINVPTNVTSAGSIWVLINGVQYNLTSGQLQTSVPTGTVTIQMQPAVNTTVGVRQLFNGWADGNLTNPRVIVVTSNTVLQAVYATQYLLSINQNGGTTTPSGWYFPATLVQVNAANPSNVTASTSRLIFEGWKGDMTSNATSVAVNMTQPVTLTAYWTKQYYVTILSPAGSPTGNGWYNAGDIATVAVQSTVQYSNGTRQIFTGWNSTSLGNNPTAKIHVNAPTTLLATWKTQYALNIQSQYGTPLGSGWYDVGSIAPVSVQSQVDYGNATRRSFTSWAGDYTGISPNVTLRMDAPKTITANWDTEYLVTFKVSGLPNSTVVKLNLNDVVHNVSMANDFQAWYPKGTLISPTLNQTIVDGFSVHQFAGWQNATGDTVDGPVTVASPETFVGSYSNSLSLPPIPGFPIEGTFLGILFGLLLLFIARRRRARRSAH